MKIAILGASGHIGASLADELSKRSGLDLVLFSRRPSASLLTGPAAETRVSQRAVSDLDFSGCDIVINAIGLGAPDKIAAAGADILRLTFEWEDKIKAALRVAPECLYVFISSGAIYGRLDQKPASSDSVAEFSVNEAEIGSGYAKAKFVAEALHRSWRHNRILDVRIFGYASQFIDLRSTFFLSQIYRALLEDTVFVTGPQDMVRDYVGAKELLSLVESVARRAQVNDAVDVFSLAPVNKFSIIDAMQQFGLKCEVVDDAERAIAPARVQYFTSFMRAREYGYRPQRSSLDIVVETAKHFFCSTKRDHWDNK
jgi:nucleoside-diphosphate-sugar epimerase